jgi:O-antigen/teichoic acid export membrane protein
MGIVAKQSFITSIGSYIGVALGALNTMILFPRIFLEEQAFLGQVNTMLAAAAIVSTFGHLGLPVTIMTFFPRLSKQEKKQFFSLSIYFLFAMILLLGALAVGYYSYFSESTLIFYALTITVTLLLFEIFASISQNYQQIIMPSLIKNVFRRLVVLIALIGAYVNENDTVLFFNILAGGYAVHFLLILIYAWPKTPPLTLNFKHFQYRHLVSYGFLVVLASGAMMAVSRLDILMLNLLVNTEAVTFFSIAFFIGSVVSVPAKSLFLSLRPIVAKAWAVKDEVAISDVYKKSAINQLIINSFLFLIIWVNIDFIYLILPESYRQGQWVVFFIALGETIAGSLGINGLILTVTDNQKYNFYTAIFLIFLTIALNLLLIPLFGMVGAAVASMIAISIYNIVRVVIVKRTFSFTPFKKDYFLIMAFVLAFLAAIISLRILGYFGVFLVVFENIVLTAMVLYAIRKTPDLYDLRNWMQGIPWLNKLI